MKKQYVVGVDIGTTSTKALVYNEKGGILGQHAVEYPFYTPHPAWVEQDPDEILHAVITSIKYSIEKSGINPEEILTVSFSSAMHSLIAMDDNGNALTRSITWADSRAQKYAEELKANGLGKEIFSRTGTPIHPMSPLLKILWFKEEATDIFKQTSKYISIKEYVFYRFFKKYIVDYSIASATGMFNLYELDWDQGALDLLELSISQLSKPMDTIALVEGLDPKYANKMGLSTDTPFTLGASDGVLANLGVNAIKPGVVAATIGTSGAVRAVTNKPVIDPKQRLFCYALTSDKWVVGGAINNGGIMYRWMRDELASAEVETAKRLGIDPYEILGQIAENIPAGSDGLIFFPFLTGERAPEWNANARGMFFGVSIMHKREHIIRAVLEGVIYRMNSVAIALEELLGPIQKVQATGGFARSTLWRQIMSDVMNKEVEVPLSVESSAFGAALLGFYATGKITSLDIVDELIETKHTHQPIADNVIKYQELMEIYIRVYHKVKDEFDSIASYQKKYVK